MTVLVPCGFLLEGDLDPDMLDERARALLDYADPHDLTLMLN